MGNKVYVAGDAACNRALSYFLLDSTGYYTVMEMEKGDTDESMIAYFKQHGAEWPDDGDHPRGNDMIAPLLLAEW